jgi:hypothetical protein
MKGVCVSKESVAQAGQDDYLGKKEGRHPAGKEGRLPVERPNQPSGRITLDQDLQCQDPKKVNRAENVWLTDDEHRRLLDKHGDEKTRLLYEHLSGYKLAHNRGYNSDYGAICAWVEGVVEQKMASAQKGKEPHGKGQPEDRFIPKTGDGAPPVWYQVLSRLLAQGYLVEKDGGHVLLEDKIAEASNRVKEMADVYRAHMGIGSR